MAPAPSGLPYNRLKRLSIRLVFPDGSRVYEFRRHRIRLIDDEGAASIFPLVTIGRFASSWVLTFRNRGLKPTSSASSPVANALPLAREVDVYSVRADPKKRRSSFPLVSNTINPSGGDTNSLSRISGNLSRQDATTASAFGSRLFSVLEVSSSLRWATHLTVNMILSLVPSAKHMGIVRPRRHESVQEF